MPFAPKRFLLFLAQCLAALSFAGASHCLPGGPPQAAGDLHLPAAAALRVEPHRLLIDDNGWVIGDSSFHRELQELEGCHATGERIRARYLEVCGASHTTHEALSNSWRKFRDQLDAMRAPYRKVTMEALHALAMLYNPTTNNSTGRREGATRGRSERGASGEG
eukprot:GHVU01033743.1.p1 GENE.GHVU01033743.1~~GHVU01033743.1.p1  ORF type:complete len:164 (+),score=20.65 GHVU01033743.1:167-658(+)